ncbi:PP2C family protein-serine/threonine phosphatase [Streptosporangium sp. NPDC087985]|uniref:PP2C family protein-serine/threonine phosphatase n=1 Tax=Streptosporangium sp. NPDC087985 TaxID=3366196 RepID=UPI003810E372
MFGGLGEAAPPAPSAAMRAMLDVTPGSASWSVPVRDASGVIVDFRMQAVSPEAEDVHGRRGEELAGLRVRLTYPSVTGTQLWQACLRVMETGVTERFIRYEHVEVADGVPRRSTYVLRLARIDDGLLATWVRDDLGQRLEENQLTAHLQKIIMPVQTEPSILPGLRVTGRYQPAEKAACLGGDWYQAIGLDDGDVLLAVGDVAGNGLAAASAMAKLRHTITGLAFARHDPAEILTALNRLLCKLRPDVLATALVARYHPGDRTLRWTHAGHPPMLLARGSHVERLLHPGVLLGVFEDATYTCGTVRLRPDDLLVMFTDGLIEKRGRDLYEGLDLMSAAVAEALGPLSPASPDRLSEVMEAMVPINEADDTCVLVAQVTGAGEPVAHPGRDG